MLEFHPLQLEDLPKLRDFFAYSGSRICDTTPGTVFMWRDMYHTEWAVHDGSLYFKVDYPGLGPTFTLPLGGGRPEHYRQIAGYCCRRGMPISFYPVPKDELDRLQTAFPNSAAIPTRDAYDYLYRAEDLQFFRGKKLSGQRNHVNKFLKTYGNWSFRVITPEDLPAVGAFLDRYAAGVDKPSASFHEDLAKTREVLGNYTTYDMLGGMLLDQLRVRRLIGVPAQQHPLRRNDLIDHRTMKQLHVHPCRQLQQGIAPGGVVLKGGFYTVSKGSVPQSLGRKLLHLGQSAVFIVGPATLGFSQSDNHSRRQKACKGEDKHNICNFLLFHRAALLRIGSR